MADRVIQALTSIADAIREKTGTTEKIKGEDIPQAISNIEAGALYESGVYYNELSDDGYYRELTYFGNMPNNSTTSTSPTLKTIRFDESVTSIPGNVFTGNEYITTVYMHDGIEYIGDYGLSNFKALTDLIYPDGTVNRIPKSLKNISASAFSGMSLTTGLTWHDDIETIGEQSFRYAKIAATTLPEKLVSIGSQAFEYSNIVIDTIPANVTTIGAWAFRYNSIITSLTFKGTPTSINTKAFTSMSGLVTINVPWAEGAVAGAPWGATNATINYNYQGG